MGDAQETDYSFYGLKIYFLHSSPTDWYIDKSIYINKTTFQSYLRNGLKSRGGSYLMHEYGHYLQEQIYGKLDYTLNISFRSSFNALMLSAEVYGSTWTEINANTLAYNYFGRPSYWDFNKFPIDSNLNNLIISNKK